MMRARRKLWSCKRHIGHVRSLTLFTFIPHAASVHVNEKYRMHSRTSVRQIYRSQSGVNIARSSIRATDKCTTHAFQRVTSRLRALMAQCTCVSAAWSSVQGHRCIPFWNGSIVKSSWVSALAFSAPFESLESVAATAERSSLAKGPQHEHAGLPIQLSLQTLVADDVGHL